MEFWLINDLNKLRLPVPPPDIEIQSGNLLQKVNISKLGEINLWGAKKLKTTTLKSFFPNPEMNYPFCQYNSYPSPLECVDIINNFKNSGEPIRFLVTKTDISFLAYIADFNYKIKDASGDIYFTIILKEFRQIKATNSNYVTKVETVRSAPPIKSNPVVSNTLDDTPNNTYTVKTGDTLMKISKKYYGTSSKWQDIYNANKKTIKDPALIYPGQTFIIPRT